MDIMTATPAVRGARWVPPARYDWLRMISDAPHWSARREAMDEELHRIRAELQLLAVGGAAAVRVLAGEIDD